MKVLLLLVSVVAVGAVEVVVLGNVKLFVLVNTLTQVTMIGGSWVNCKIRRLLVDG